MVEDNENVSLTSDDEQARRLCALVVALSNARSPIPSADIHAAYYPDLADDAFRRKFSRDREKLVECGMVVRSVGKDDKEASWQADATSFADSALLSEDDALMLDVLGTQFVDDPSFAHRDDLRFALAKIDHAFGTLSAARIAPQRRDGAKVLQTMLSCLAGGSLARITYVDAKGARSERVVAPYGQFGLRDNVYFVCAQVTDGIVCEHDPRFFRADRIEKASAAKGGFVVPEDFSVGDFIRLPFQIGPTTCHALLLPSAESDRDMVLDLERCAISNQDGMLEVAVSSVEDAARWCVAAGIEPREPKELVSAWHDILSRAAQFEARDVPEVATPVAKRSPKARRGRPGGANEMRELVALVSSLSHEGAALTPEVVSARLGVTVERARFLINLVLTACTDTSYQLPLSLSDADGVVLSRSHGVAGRPIRLTRGETDALVSVLDELGFPADDPLRLEVLAAFAPVGITEEQARTHVDDALSQDDNEVLEACSRTITSGGTLSFMYAGLQRKGRERRIVSPQALRRSGDLWYLDGHDHARSAQRTFRIDRMSDVRVVPTPDAQDHADAGVQKTERQVKVAFLDRAPLDLFEWPRLEVLGEQDGALVASLPFYGGVWLPRHLAACSDVVITSDGDLAALVRKVAAQRQTSYSSASSSPPISSSTPNAAGSSSSLPVWKG